MTNVTFDRGVSRVKRWDEELELLKKCYYYTYYIVQHTLKRQKKDTHVLLVTQIAYRNE